MAVLCLMPRRTPPVGGQNLHEGCSHRRAPRIVVNMPRAQMPIETLHEPAEAALVRASRWAVAVTLACLPLYVVRFRAGPVPTTLLEVMVLATVVMYVVARWREGMRRPIRTPLDIPILVLLLAGLIAVVIPSDHAGALGLYLSLI